MSKIECRNDGSINSGISMIKSTISPNRRQTLIFIIIFCSFIFPKSVQSSPIRYTQDNSAIFANSCMLESSDKDYESGIIIQNHTDSKTKEIKLATVLFVLPNSKFNGKRLVVGDTIVPNKDKNNVTEENGLCKCKSKEQKAPFPITFIHLGSKETTVIVPTQKISESFIENTLGRFKSSSKMSDTDRKILIALLHHKLIIQNNNRYCTDKCLQWLDLEKINSPNQPGNQLPPLLILYQISLFDKNNWPLRLAQISSMPVGTAPLSHSTRKQNNIVVLDNGKVVLFENEKFVEPSNNENKEYTRLNSNIVRDDVIALLNKEPKISQSLMEEVFTLVLQSNSIQQTFPLYCETMKISQDGLDQEKLCQAVLPITNTDKAYIKYKIKILCQLCESQLEIKEYKNALTNILTAERLYENLQDKKSSGIRYDHMLYLASTAYRVCGYKDKSVEYFKMMISSCASRHVKYSIEEYELEKQLCSLYLRIGYYDEYLKLLSSLVSNRTKYPEISSLKNNSLIWRFRDLSGKLDHLNSDQVTRFKLLCSSYEESCPQNEKKYIGDLIKMVPINNETALCKENGATAKEPAAFERFKYLGQHPELFHLNFTTEQTEILIEGILDNICNDLEKKSNVYSFAYKEFFSCRFAFRQYLKRDVINSLSAFKFKATDSSNKSMILIFHEQKCPTHYIYHYDSDNPNKVGMCSASSTIKDTAIRLTDLLTAYDNNRQKLIKLIKHNDSIDSPDQQNQLSEDISNLYQTRSQLIDLCGEEAVKKANI